MMCSLLDTDETASPFLRNVDSLVPLLMLFFLSEAR